MSRCRFDDEECDCGLCYRDCRTGLTFKEVRGMLWRATSDSRRWLYKRRGSVLRLWHRLKRSMWREHRELCAYAREVQS